MNDQWFVHSDGQQLGPYTGQQLVEFAQHGNIIPETMVWAEGMPEWMPAAQIPGLFPSEPIQAAPPVQASAPTTSAAWNPNVARGLAAPAAVVKNPSPAVEPAAPVGGDYPYFKVYPTSFGLWVGTFAGSMVLMVVSFFAMIAGAASGSMNTGLILFFLALGIHTFSIVLFHMYLYRAWFCLQMGGVRTSPGKAIGFLFIPFFNFYWVFVAINGLAKDWNHVTANYVNLVQAPKLGETVFLLVCIGMFFPPLALVMIFPMMSQLCKGINFFASRRDPNAATSAFARPSFGLR